MQLIGKILFTVLLSLAVGGCGADTSKKITQDEALAIMASNSNVIILDVRKQDEYDKRHIPGALLVPLDDLKGGDFSKLPDKDAMILVYCRTGRRSAKAATLIAEHGYKNVYDFGGIIDWKGEVEGTDLE